MSDFLETYHARHVFLPVIHAQNLPQAVYNTQIAREAGADGVFLINQGRGGSSMPFEELIDLYHEMRDRFPFFWIGLNSLDRGHEAIDDIPRSLQGLWVDSSGINETGLNEKARSFAVSREARRWRGLYFGGVGFKYQPAPADVARAAKNAMPFVDVITTSGDATGSAPTIEKIEAIKQVIGAHPLAIASGMSPDNVQKFMPIADCFLVATGISRSFTELDSKKTTAFARKLGK